MINIHDKVNTTNLFFDKINIIMKNIQKIFFEINDKIKKIKKIYNSLMNENNDKLSLYGLDTLNFQSKLFKLQFENCDHMYKVLCNRIYGDYFKLYKIIINTCSNSSLVDQKILSFVNKNHNITVYKDLEPTKEYSENDLFIVHDLINQVIILLSDFLKTKENTDNRHQDLIKSGFKINSFSYSYNYHKYLLQNQLELYINYLDFYNHNHLKYFQKIQRQSESILDDIKQEIMFDKNNLLDELKNEFSQVQQQNYNINKNNNLNNNQELKNNNHKNYNIIKTIKRNITDKITDNNIKNITDNNIENITDNNIENITDNNIENITDNNIEYNNIENNINNNIENNINNNIENNINNNIKNNIDNNIENKSINNIENKSINNIENKSINNIENNIENNIDNNIENITIKNKDITDDNIINNNIENNIDNNIENNELDNDNLSVASSITMEE